MPEEEGEPKMIMGPRGSAAVDIALVAVVGVGIKLLFTNIDAVGWRYSSIPAFVAAVLATIFLLRHRGKIFPMVLGHASWDMLGLTIRHLEALDGV